MKRTLSKKSISLHKQNTLKQELKGIENTHLTSQNILEKLLHPSNSQKKLVLQPRKYNPKFEKKDYETLTQQSYELKKQLNIEKQNVSNLKFQLSQNQRKIRFLQSIQQKWQQSIKAQQESKKQPVYTEILKKKIQQLTELYMNAEEKIKQLKRLPHISVFEESNVENQYLIRETTRLKAIITSLTTNNEEDDNLENKFLKLMKEENQKLKSTIRLLENDKNLLKSRQILQKRQLNDYRKQIEQLKLTITMKQAQIQTTINEYKNMIYKKAQQLLKQQEKKQNQQLINLQRQVQNQKRYVKQVEVEKQMINSQYEKLKKNEIINENKKNCQDKEKNELRVENNRLKKTIQDLKDQLERQQENFKIIELENRKKKREKIKTVITKRIEEYPPVKYQDLELPIMILIHNMENGTLKSVDDLFQEDQLKCGKLVEIFCEEPLSLDRGQAMKLARYIVEEDTSKRIIYNENASASRQCCVQTLKAAMNMMKQCRKTSNEDIWRCILAKSKKLIPQLQKLSGTSLSKEQFLIILSRHIRENFSDYVTFVILQSLDLAASETEIMIKVDKLLVILNAILANKYTIQSK